MSGFLELPRCPADKFTTVAVVLSTDDTPFNEAVAAWSPEWATRVRCWQLTGQAHGVYVVPWGTVDYEPLYLAHDDGSLAAEIRHAIAYLGSKSAEWRCSALVRGEVESALWDAGAERREEKRREREAQRQAARREAQKRQQQTGATQGAVA